ncbi:MAG TPA: CoA transferase [Candidatus Binataceae bacterium]|nr:CoA transferase [Candidatus Binataceae bacterium]
MSNKGRHLLDGYKVLDFTHFIAGPTTTRLMAGMGAEIVKVELAPHGDQARDVEYIRGKRSAYFIQQNRGKQSLCLNLRNPAAVAIIMDLIPQMDVMIENFAPGVIGSMGFDYATVKRLNPRIVMCSISALGQTGPLAHDTGFDYIGQAYAGVTSLIGEPDGPPYLPMIAIGDVSTGVHALSAIACALLYRERTGEGQYIDISLLDSYFHCQTVGVQLHSASGGQKEIRRSGLHLGSFCPAGVFKGQRWHIVIIAWLDNHWARVCEALGRPELATDPRYSSVPRRSANKAEIIKMIEAWLASMPSDEASIERLRACRVPVAPVLSVSEAMKHPHLIERGTVRTVHDRILGDFQIPGFPFRFSGFPEELELDAPMLGEHNHAVLEKYLGYPPERVQQLTADAVLHSASY